MYTHMPYFIDKDTGLFCVAKDLVTHRRPDEINSSTFRPWCSVFGSLDNYNFLDFPFLPISHLEVHCSPILHNNIYSLSYNRSIYTKTKNNSEWNKVSGYVWQGYQDQNGLNYVNGNECFINSKQIKVPFNMHILRICPYEDYHIITGHAKSKLRSFLYDGKQFAEIIANGNSVYKCNIVDDVLFYSVAEDESLKETYKIHQTKDFNFVYNSEVFQSEL